jgi:WD40 repeat protein
MAAPPRELVFISYSHRNTEWRDRLLILLKPFIRQGRLQVWADPYIQAGALWRREIEGALEGCAVGVILLTPDLLASEFITKVEIPQLLSAAQARKLKLLVVPIQAHAAGSTSFLEGDLLDYQWPWPPDKPVDELDGRLRNAALVKITEAIVSAAGAKGMGPDQTEASERSASRPVAPQARRAVVHGVPAFPPHYLRWDKAHELVKTALLGPSAVVGVSAGVASVGVHGQGGLGKTVIAQAMAHDDEVLRAFPDGIFWVTVGQEPRLETLQADLAEWVGRPASIDNVASGARHLRDAFLGRACLVIVDDVWHFAHAKAFDVLKGASRLLVTTRDPGILTALGARDVRLGTLPPELAMELLASWAGVSKQSLPSEAAEVAKEVNFLPLALALAGAQIRDGGSWRDLVIALEAGNLIYLDHPYGSVFKSLQANLDAIGAHDSARYIELAVFPEDTEVPASVIAQLWQRTIGLDSNESHSLIRRLASRGLVRVVDDGAPGPTVTLHDLQSDFVKLVVRNAMGLHGQLVDAWRAALPAHRDSSSTSADSWATLRDVTNYPWQFLAYHLTRAGYETELRDLLTSLPWISEKIRRFSVSALRADYRGMTLDAGLRVVDDTLALSADVLARNTSALPSQVAGRVHEPVDRRVRTLVESARATLSQEGQLRPLTACLTPPGGALRRTFDGHGDVCALMALSDGHRVVSASADGTVRLWRIANGQILQTFEGHRGEGLRRVALLPDGQSILSATDGRTLKLWSLATGNVLRTYVGHHEEVTTILIIQDGQRAVLQGYRQDNERTIEVLDLVTGGVLWTIKCDDILIEVLPDGRAFSTSGNRLDYWDLSTRQALMSFRGHLRAVEAVALLPDGERVLSASADGMLRLWNLLSGQCIAIFKGHKQAVHDVKVLHDGQRALSASSDRTLKLWDLATGHILQTFEGHADDVRSVALLPDGQSALSAGGRDTVKLWDLGLARASLALEGHCAEVRIVAAQPDGQRAFSFGADRTLKLWDLSSGRVLRTVEKCQHEVSALAMLPGGDHAVSALFAGDLSHWVQVWDLLSGHVVKNFRVNGMVRKILVLPNGRRAFLVGDASCVLDLASGRCSRSLVELSTDAAMLPDGRRALAADWNTAKLLDLATGKVVRSLERHDKLISKVSVLPDGQHALSFSLDSTVKLWNLSTGVALRTVDAPDAWLYSPSVSPNGQRAVSVDFRRLVLWDPATGKSEGEFHDDARVTCLSDFTKDGVIVVGNALGRVYGLRL